ncbi:netrin receptor unc-5-like [Vanessa atalanta]|uniref:netrin receptor unc-5-like n=1 Tax=Vanessa atalanta TaxID=42275 RepID=UPI000E774BAB|nr:netrin receptor unc-5-like [Vanessa tameamea]XP_047527131.1 netrin receptor unc-5-like [Vanessa atalanta]
MCGYVLWIILLVSFSVGKVRNGGTEQTTEKETRPEYIHPDGLLNFDPYLSDFKPVVEEDDYIPLPENDETIDGLPIFLIEPKNSYVLRIKPATLLCRAANALQVFFKCNDVRTDKTVQLEHVDPQNGVRVVEAELNVTRNELDEYFGGRYSCECYAWNSKGRIRSQGVFIEFAYIKKQFAHQPQSITVEAGRQVSFRCSPPPAAPPATIKWMRNGVAIEANDETLVLPKVGLQDMANYSCIAENIAGKRESDVAVLSVYVNGGWSDWSPWAPCRCGVQSSGRRRTRTCTMPAPANGGAPCRGQGSQSDDDCLRCQNGAWSPWSAWSACSEECVRVRRRQCSGTCPGSTLQHAACVDGLCSAGFRIYKNNITLYVGIGITVAMLAAGAAILYVWCKYKTVRPGYTAARTGIPKSYSGRDKGNAAPDLTRTCNEYWMRPDNHYDMPQLRDSYASPFGNRSRQQSSAGSNHYEMKPYSPSGDSASSCYTNSRTMTSRSSECSSQLAELVTSSSHSKVDVAVTLPPGPSDNSYRDKICLTIVK